MTTDGDLPRRVELRLPHTLSSHSTTPAGAVIAALCQHYLDKDDVIWWSVWTTPGLTDDVRAATVGGGGSAERWDVQRGDMLLVQGAERGMRCGVSRGRGCAGSQARRGLAQLLVK